MQNFLEDMGFSEAATLWKDIFTKSQIEMNDKTITNNVSCV